MRKMLFAAIFGLIAFAAIPETIKSQSFSIRCYKCKEYAERHRYESSCPGCNAWRMFRLEKGEDAHKLVYHCAHGHTLKIDAKTEERE